MTDPNSLPTKSAQPLDLEALGRIVNATGVPLHEGTDEERALSLLNTIVIETSAGASILKIGRATEDLKKYGIALAKLQTSAEALRKIGFGAPLPPESFMNSAQHWLDAHRRLLDKDASGPNRDYLLTPFYPKALGAYAALFGGKPTIWVNEKQGKLASSAAVRFSEQLIKDAAKAEPLLLLGKNKLTSSEQHIMRGWVSASTEALAKNLQKAMKGRYEYKPEAGELPLKNPSDLPLKWEAYRNLYLTVTCSEG